MASGLSVVGGVTFTGAAAHPNPIQDWHDLHEARDRLDELYVFETDLDADTAGYDEYVGDPDGGWEPIGTPSEPFTGVLNGGGREIADLRVEADDHAGLLGASAGIVDDLHLVDCRITGAQYVGGIAGTNRIEERTDPTRVGEIVGSSVTGEVSGDTAVGGLVGENNSDLENCSATAIVEGAESVGGLLGATTVPVTTSYAVGEVTGDRETGGLIGTVSGAEVTESAAAVTVDGEIAAGGLAGAVGDDGAIRDAAATGGTRAADAVGGLVGRSAGELARSFAAGPVVGDGDVGGVVGANQGPITDCYCDPAATGVEDGVGTGEGEVTALETDEMIGERAREHMDGFDFEDTWAAVTDPPNYPTLQWLHGTAAAPSLRFEPGAREEPDDGRTTAADEDGLDTSADGGDDDSIPGFGLGSGLAALAGGSYVLYRRLRPGTETADDR